VILGFGLPFCSTCEKTLHYTTVPTGKTFKRKKKNREEISCNVPPMFTNDDATGFVRKDMAPAVLNKGMLFMFGSATGIDLGNSKCEYTAAQRGYFTLEDLFKKDIPVFKSNQGTDWMNKAGFYWKKSDGTVVAFGIMGVTAGGKGKAVDPKIITNALGPNY